MDTLSVGKRLVEFCKRGENIQAIDELYGEDVENHEVVGMGDVFPKDMKGKALIRENNVKWMEMHEFHGGDVKGPWPHGDRFAVLFTMDVTAKDGPMAGQRMKGEEVGLYTVKDGEIVNVEWFYDMSGCE